MSKIRITFITFIFGALNYWGCGAQDQSLMGHSEKVLVIGRHADMLARVTNMLKSHNYAAIGAQTNEEAIQLFAKEQPMAVVIGGGVDGESRSFFHRTFSVSAKVIDAHPQTILSELKNAFSPE